VKTMRCLLFLLVASLLQFSSSCAQPRVVNPRSVSSPRVDSIGSATPRLTFLVFGDWGTGGKGQKQVADGMSDVRRRLGADLALGTGDNFYNSGVESVTDPQWERKFERMYDSARFPIRFAMTLGNHDYGKNPDAQVAYTQRSTRWFMPSRYYTFSLVLSDSTVVQFFALDTQNLVRGSSSIRGKQLAWLDSALAASVARWKIVFGHHPPFSNGAHGNNKRLIKELVPILEKHGVTALFSGHDHDLQALRPVNGVRYFVSGGGAGARSVAWKNNTLFAATNLGFAWCRVTGSSFEVAFFDRHGTLLWSKKIF